MVTVLLVDDDQAIGRLVKVILATENIDVERAHNGSAALELLKDGNQQPDMILLDLEMPGMDGREVFQEARRSGVTCPIVFCSAYGAETANRDLGAQGAIEKPFTPDALIACVRALTNGNS